MEALVIAGVILVMVLLIAHSGKSSSKPAPVTKQTKVEVKQPEAVKEPVYRTEDILQMRDNISFINKNTDYIFSINDDFQASLNFKAQAEALVELSQEDRAIDLAEAMMVLEKTILYKMVEDQSSKTLDDLMPIVNRLEEEYGNRVAVHVKLMSLSSGYETRDNYMQIVHTHLYNKLLNKESITQYLALAEENGTLVSNYADVMSPLGQRLASVLFDIALED